MPATLTHPLHTSLPLLAPPVACANTGAVVTASLGLPSSVGAALTTLGAAGTVGAVALFPAGTRAAVPVQVELENVCVMLIFAVTGEGGAVAASSLGAGAGIIGAGWGGGEMIACSAGRKGGGVAGLAMAILGASAGGGGGGGVGAGVGLGIGEVGAWIWPSPISVASWANVSVIAMHKTRRAGPCIVNDDDEPIAQ